MCFWTFVYLLGRNVYSDPLMVKVKVAQLCLTLCDPVDCIVLGILQARILEWVAFPSPGDLPNLGIEPRSPTMQADSIPAEPQGKAKNTGVGSLSLLQGILPTQELNRGLLHCRQILYQLSYGGKLTPFNLDYFAFYNWVVVGDLGSVPELGRSPGEGKGYLLQKCFFFLYILDISPLSDI